LENKETSENTSFVTPFIKLEIISVESNNADKVLGLNYTIKSKEGVREFISNRTFNHILELRNNLISKVKGFKQPESGKFLEINNK
jgi:hypothetical protein